MLTLLIVLLVAIGLGLGLVFGMIGLFVKLLPVILAIGAVYWLVQQTKSV
ncbi:MAG: hypothetical protein IJT34_11470 [Butyrivibrio sp.]|nr:hypothetical protein [Butyrivibrio sp.]